MNKQIDRLREFYRSGATRSLDFRREALRRLRASLEAHCDELFVALKEDLGKSAKESYMSELGMAFAEIDHLIHRLPRLMRPKRVRGAMPVFPSRSRVMCEPLGVVLVISPWNYPVNLTFAPLAGAIAAGNCVVVKPSQTSAATREVMGKVVAEAFAPEHVAWMNLDHEETDRLLDEPFDHIFFTGSASFGREVMRKAAPHLTPITLELGGKSPCIISASADLRIAARRVAWGKTFNTGQTCIAPDHVWVEQEVADRFVEMVKEELVVLFGEDPHKSDLYPRIVSRRALDRLVGYLDGNSGRVVHGGEWSADDRYMAPTVLRDVPLDSPVMRDEIFGPIIPILEYRRIEEVAEFVASRPKPLALYYFGRQEEGRRVLGLTTSGGACINDVVMHVANPHLPFGGVGGSGMGRYHGDESFYTFSNRRSVLISGRKVDIPLRYPPYPSLKLLKRFL